MKGLGGGKNVIVLVHPQNTPRIALDGVRDRLLKVNDSFGRSGAAGTVEPEGRLPGFGSGWRQFRRGGA